MKRLTHEQVWTAIDRLADRYGLSVSGLAKKAGLDATSFNKSKRMGPDGHKRWPSTESLAKVLEATSATVEEFIALLGSEGLRKPQFRVPLARSNMPMLGTLHDVEGRTSEHGWDELNIPGMDDINAFAIEVADRQFEPMYRAGDRLVLSPAESIRPRDRIVVCHKSNGLMARELKRSTAKTLELKSMRPGEPDETIMLDSVSWVARIVWVSQ